MTATVAGIHLSGNHAGRPAGNAVPDGSLYSCSTHSLIYQSSYAGNSWATWATLGTAGAYVAGGTDVAIADGGTGASTKAAAFDALSPMTTAGDIIIGGASGTGTRLAAGSTSGHVLTSTGAGSAPSWQAAGGGGGVSLPLPDMIPASPHASDQEFNAALSGDTTYGTLTTTTVAGSLLYIKHVRTGAGCSGKTWAAPSTPFEVVTKMSDSSIPSGTNYHHAGILLRDNAGKGCTLGLVTNAAAAYLVLYRWTNATTFASNIDVALNLDARTDRLPEYLKLVVTSASSVTAYWSHKGLYWKSVGTIAAVTTGLAAVDGVGVGIGDPNGTTTVEAWFDFQRFA